MTKSATETASGTDPALTVYFDGSCPLCTVEIAHYRAQTGAERVHFVDVSQDTPDLGPDLTRNDAMRRFHVRGPDGHLLSGARGFIAIWSVLPRWRWAARIASLPALPALLEGMYRIFLPIRPTLSKLAARLGARPANRCSCDE